MARETVLGTAPSPIIFAETGSRDAVVGDLILAEAGAAVTHYQMTAEVGTFVLAGQDAAFDQIAARQVGLAGFPTPIIITESAGRQSTFGHLTYSEATPTNAYSLSAERGIFALSGQDADLIFTGGFKPAVGSFVLSGQAVNLRQTRRLIAEVGTFTYRLATAQENMQAFAGTFVLAGQDADLVYNPISSTLSAAGGSFVLAFPPVSFTRTLPMAAGVGEFVLAGQDIGFLRPYRIAADVGTFILTGLAVTLTAPAIIAYPLSSRTITI